MHFGACCGGQIHRVEQRVCCRGCLKRNNRIPTGQRGLQGEGCAGQYPISDLLAEEEGASDRQERDKESSVCCLWILMRQPAFSREPYFVLSTVLCGIWADRSWGRFWGWDPKENGALTPIRIPVLESCGSGGF